MVDIIKNCVNDYINDLISMDQFVENMKCVYDNVIRSKNMGTDLDIIALISHIHTFAYWRWSNIELHKEVKGFQNIMLGKVNYNYSAFVKLPQIGNSTGGLSASNSISKKTIKDMFSKHIDSPKTVKDIIHNTIYNLVINTDFSCVEESDFEFINCGEDVELSHIETTLHRLIEYYEGLCAFYLHISYDVNSGFTYVIT